MRGKGDSKGMSDWKEERQDYILGGIAIILLGILLSGSAVWGLVVNVYSMNSGLAPPLFLILGAGTIIMGIFISLHKPEKQEGAVESEKASTPTGGISP